MLAGRKLFKAGDYPGARLALESCDLQSDDMATMFYIMVLDALDDQVAKQDAVRRFLDDSTAFRSDTVLTMLLRQAERACLPSEDIARLLAAAQSRDLAQSSLGAACRAAAQRQAFAAEHGIQARYVRLVSLGKTCLPWTLPNRWGFRSPAQFITDFNPFCLAAHTLAGVIDALRSDFADYTDPAKIVAESSGKEAAVPMRHDQSARWKHNKGNHWTENGYAALRGNLANKIDNFRRSCEPGQPLVFLMAGLFRVQLQDRNYLPRLHAAITRAASRDDWHLIITNESHDIPATGPVQVDARTMTFHCPVPRPNYNWFDLDLADSPAGLDFERAYATSLLACYRQFGL